MWHSRPILTCSITSQFKSDGFFHHHRVSLPHPFFMATISVAAAILRYLSPPDILPLIRTHPHSVSSTTISMTPKHEGSVEGDFDCTQGTTCLPMDLYSNQRTRNQFRPRNATKGTTSYQLRQYAEATLGGGSLRKIVKLPEGEDENEWLAVNSMPSPMIA
ncbi:Mitotic exit network component [Cadophora gregata f. sp. sojae]|nr:Mitotic exit network component [Cadophora gregata f. sp. sojae]